MRKFKDTLSIIMGIVVIALFIATVWKEGTVLGSIHGALWWIWSGCTVVFMILTIIGLIPKSKATKSNADRIKAGVTFHGVVGTMITGTMPDKDYTQETDHLPQKNLFGIQENHTQHGICSVCGEDFNMYGGCKCNDYMPEALRVPPEQRYHEPEEPCDHKWGDGRDAVEDVDDMYNEDMNGVMCGRCGAVGATREELSAKDIKDIVKDVQNTPMHGIPIQSVCGGGDKQNG